MAEWTCMGAVSRLAPIRDYIESLVHQSARQDPLVAARHRAFIAPRLLGGFAALAALPVYLIARGVPGVLEILVFAWLVVPILSAYFLSRTGRYESAHTLSSLALTGLIAVVAAETGGLTSFAAVWLVVVPLEAALSSSRRVIIAASASALAAACLLLLLGAIGSLPAYSDPNGHAELMGVGIISAALYAAGLALGAESLVRTSIRLLCAEEEQSRLLARATSDVVTRHGRGGAVLFVSPAAEPLFGAPRQDLLGHGLFDRVHIADRPAYLYALADAAAGQMRSAEFRFRREDATSAERLAVRYIWIEMRCQPLDLLAAGSSPSPASEVVAVMRDITEQKMQEQALEVVRAEAEAANATKIRFLATMSHELRTPLNAIIGFSDMLVSDAEMKLDAARRREYAQLINASGYHLLSVVNGILDMSKIETGNFEITPEPFAPAETIGRCCELMRPKARESGIELVVRLPSDLPDVLADKRALNQILLNLLSNAIKFTDAGGTVSVSASTEPQWVAVAVEDDGVGIGEADLRRVGDPFFQASASYDRRHDGTGLGLSIVKGLVALHGGHLDITSRLGQGTTVTVRLPRDRASIAGGRDKSPAREAVCVVPAMHRKMQVKKSA